MREILMLGLLAGLSVFAPAPGPCVLVLLIVVVGLSLLPAWGREVPAGHLGRDRVLLLLGLFLLAMPLPTTGAALGWAISIAAMLFVLGWVNRLKKQPNWRGQGRQREIALTALVLLVASAGTAGVTRGVLAFRSTMKIPPGSLEFLVVMAIWAGAWFGLDSALRESGPRVGRGFLWDRRYSLGLILVCGIIYLRAALS